MQHDESSFTATDGTSLYYQRWRPDGKPRAVMVILHGFGDHSGRYMNVIDHFEPLGLAFYSFDYRGHGMSAGNRGYIESWSEYHDDLDSFLSLVKEQEKNLPLFIYGHSMGGTVILDYLLHNQIDIKGVIASAPLLAQPGISPILVMLSRILSRVKPGFPINTKLNADTISRDKNEVLKYVTDPLVHSTGTPRLGTELTATINQIHENAGKFKYPLLIVQGSDDALVPIEGTTEFFENVSSEDKKMNIYPHGFHELHNDNDKEKVLSDIADWLQKHL